MTALHDFIQASASYFGLPVDQLTQGSTLDAAQGDMEVVLRIALKPEDVAGIAARMQRMALERKVDEAQAAEAAKRAADEGRAVEGMELEVLRNRYNALHPAEKSRFGSIHRFCVTGGALPEPEVVEKAELPPHVYLAPSDATEQQKAMAVGRDARGWFAVDPADLTPGQRLRHGLDGVNGVTSNADDFGGLPG